MKILLSVGIQLAQADISVDQAQDLGLISYLSFLKIKAAQQQPITKVITILLSNWRLLVGYNYYLI
jgi:hypothetical protein